MRVARGERKAWAREHFVGFENILIPSFTADLGSLDEEAIRHDVRMSIAHGFFSTFAAGIGLGPDEARRYLEIVVDEAAGKIQVGFPLMARSREEGLAMLAAAEKIGCSHVLIHYPPGMGGRSSDELYGFIKQFADATDLGVALWATDGSEFRDLHPSNVPMDTIDRLADLPNVVALKMMTTLDEATHFECCERFGDRLLIGPVKFSFLPMLVKQYGVQWSGAWTVEALQSPERPLAVSAFKAMRDGDAAEGMKRYWEAAPAYQSLLQLMAPLLPSGMHPWLHLKYYQWCVGGNGGAVRPGASVHDTVAPLDRPAMDAIKAAYRRVGITPREDDQEFLVGRSNYRKGARAADAQLAGSTR